MARVPASEATRNEIKRMWAGQSESIDASSFVRQAVRLMIEQALEAESVSAWAVGYYEHGKELREEGSRGHRNGLRVSQLKSAEGRHRVRGTAGTWTRWLALGDSSSALAGALQELERLAVDMYARGLSMRDIECAFTDAAGRCVLSRSAASRVSEGAVGEYQEFARRDLSSNRAGVSVRRWHCRALAFGTTP